MHNFESSLLDHGKKKVELAPTPGTPAQTDLREKRWGVSQWPAWCCWIERRRTIPRCLYQKEGREVEAAPTFWAFQCASLQKESSSLSSNSMILWDSERTHNPEMFPLEGKERSSDCTNIIQCIVLKKRCRWLLATTTALRDREKWIQSRSSPETERK